jgi:hypothetical protein
MNVHILDHMYTNLDQPHGSENTSGRKGLYLQAGVVDVCREAAAAHGLASTTPGWARLGSHWRRASDLI